MFVLPACSWCCALRILKGVGSDYRRDWCWWCWWWWCPWDCPSPVLHTTRSSLCWPNTRDILPTSSAGETNTDWRTEWCRAAPASGMEECRTSAGAGTTPPSSPLWTTSVRTATTFTKSQTFTLCAGPGLRLIITQVYVVFQGWLLQFRLFSILSSGFVAGGG